VALLASVPPQGLLPSLWGMAVTHPALLWGIGLLQTGGPRYASLDLLRRALFSERTPDHRLRGYARWLQGESQRVSLDLLGLDPLRLRRDHGIPMLVLGGGRDAFFSPGLVRDTARHYGTEALIFPDLAHALMLEADWEQPADHLRRWLEARLTR
jgi:alpha-beta hydrolase superfamily lysophospholipase